MMRTKNIIRIIYVVTLLVFIFLALVQGARRLPELFVIFPLSLFLILRSTSGQALTFIGIVLLFFCPLFLSFGKEGLTDRFASAAFIFLSFGVLKNIAHQIGYNES